MRVLNHKNWPYRVANVKRPLGWKSESKQLAVWNEECETVIEDPRIEWCKKNIDNKWKQITTTNGDDFYFTNEADLIMFLLRWEAT